MATFQEILKKSQASGAETVRQSAAWFRRQAKSFKDANQLMASERGNLTTRARPGRMVMFFYDAKLKEELPFWDRFPVGFVVQDQGNGRFQALNLHYLAPGLRAKLFDALTENFLNGARKPQNKRLELTYQALRGASRVKAFQPCFKTYLHGHVRSRFLEVPYEEWAIAMMLPLARFEKKTANQVWAESARSLKR